jgi:hypothetical protein
VYTDANRNGTIDVEQGEAQRVNMMSAAKQLQFHRGGEGEVGDASAGCQVIEAKQYDHFQQILAEAPQSQQKFSYLMTDVNELPQIDQNNRAFDSSAIVLPVGPEDTAAANGSDEGGLGRVIQPTVFVKGGRKVRFWPFFVISVARKCPVLLDAVLHNSAKTVEMTILR